MSRYQLTPAQAREMYDGVTRISNNLGIDPRVTAGVMSFETGGTLNPWQAGPTTKYGQHRGLIQWGQPQARQYGVSAASPIPVQLAAVEKYMRDRGVRPGMGAANVYAAVLRGNANSVDGVADKNGTTAGSGARQITGAHYGAYDNLRALAGLNPGASGVAMLNGRTPAGGAMSDPSYTSALSGASPGSAPTITTAGVTGPVTTPVTNGMPANQVTPASATATTPDNGGGSQTTPSQMIPDASYGDIPLPDLDYAPQQQQEEWSPAVASNDTPMPGGFSDVGGGNAPIDFGQDTLAGMNYLAEGAAHKQKLAQNAQFDLGDIFAQSAGDMERIGTAGKATSLRDALKVINSQNNQQRGFG